MPTSANGTDSKDRDTFDQAMKALESQIANVGAHVTVDSTTRLAYSREIKAMSKKLESDALAGRISWIDASKQAQETRNLIMEIFRRLSTPVGRAMSQQLKITGYSMNELVARHTMDLFGEKAIFKILPSSKKNLVYASIVRSAGRSNQKVNVAMTRVSYAGRGLIVISIAISAYTVAKSTDKLSTAGKELVSVGAGIGGGVAGGALAGLACGPGAPICVTVGAFVGGTLAAFGISFIW
jgi:hypothetical protein